MIFTGFRDTDLGNKKKKKKGRRRSRIRFRDTDCLFPSVPTKKPTRFLLCLGNTDQDRLFPHRADGFELTIRPNRDQAKEDEAVEDEDKEEEEAVAELDDDNCGFKQRPFSGFVKGFARICGLKGKNKVKWPLSPNMLHK